MLISKGKKKHIIAQRYLCTKNKFGFTVAEKEHYYLENEPRERAEIMGAAGTGRGKTRWMAQRRQNSWAQAEPAGEGPWSRFYRYPSTIRKPCGPSCGGGCVQHVSALPCSSRAGGARKHGPSPRRTQGCSSASRLASGCPRSTRELCFAGSQGKTTSSSQAE